MTIEKKVSAALLVAIAAQTAVGLLWAGAAVERIDALEQHVEQAKPIGERLARVEARLEAMRAQLDRIETKVER